MNTHNLRCHLNTRGRLYREHCKQMVSKSIDIFYYTTMLSTIAGFLQTHVLLELTQAPVQGSSGVVSVAPNPDEMEHDGKCHSIINYITEHSHVHRDGRVTCTYITAYLWWYW